MVACIVVTWPAAPRAQSQDEARPAPALDQANIPTAAVTPGVKVLLDGITFERADRLGFRLNLVNLWRPAQMKELTKLYEDLWFNPRNISIAADLAPLGGEHARARELGDWSAGIDWAIYDETSLFRPEAVAILMEQGLQLIEQMEVSAAAVGKEQNELFKNMETKTRSELVARADHACANHATGFDQGNWDTDADSTLQQLLQNAKSACSARTGEPAAKQALVEGMLSAIERRLQNQSCIRLHIADRFVALTALAAEWQSEWDTLCAPRKKIDSSYMEKVRQRLSSGFTVGAELFLVGHAKVLPMMDGSDEVELSRTVDLHFSLEATYRRLDDLAPIDITANLVRISTGPGNTTTRHGLTASVASPPMSWSDSGVVLSLTGALDIEFADASSANVAYDLEERLAIPLADKVFLILAVREAWHEGKEWDVRPSFSLAWSYAKDGKDLARAIDIPLSQR